METGSAPAQFNLRVGDKLYDLGEAEFGGVLYDIVTTLVYEKRVDRASYVMQCRESELTGSGSVHFDPMCVSLYRHLKEDPYHGKVYEDLGGETHSFRLHSIIDGLEAVAFYLRAGAMVPHFLVGRPEEDLLIVLDRGARSELRVDDPAWLERIARLLSD